MYIGPFYNCNHGASGIFTFVTSGLLMHIESGASYGFLGIRTPSHAHRVGRELPFFGLSRVFRGVCACVLHIGRRRGASRRDFHPGRTAGRGPADWRVGRGAWWGCAWAARGRQAAGPRPAGRPRAAQPPPPPDVQNTRTNPAKNARKAEKR